MEESQEPQIEPIHFQQSTVLVVEQWPARTSFAPAWLERRAHERKAKVSGDTVTIRASNGTAVYALRRDLPMVNGGIVADLTEGDTPGRLRQRGAKYRPAPSGEEE